LEAALAETRGRNNRIRRTWIRRRRRRRRKISQKTATEY
jgi:hypothetical protein